ncbi:efflux RND transporter periplasmic adaptor subunit [Novosphingobium guangzhouense]|uniref:efflux RND transporter periplasmic adaptor subunit n=1 Tax=Novosphingobium guangzhouense TaxID=1850347 RepID=UPI000CCC21BB|nr:efflux RND transporter periplasmic adaptor subunit [Novosphingobium guangzhouense]
MSDPHPRRRLLFWSAALGVLALGAAYALHQPAPKAHTTLPQVGLTRAERQNVPQTIAVVGTVQPIVSATVRAQLSGTIFSIDVREGQAVRKGQRLAQIDPRPYRIAIDQAQGTLARDRAQLQNARLDLGRYQRLLADNSVARQQVDTQLSTVRQLEGTVAADRAALESARLNLRYTDLVAPVAGRVGLRRADIGAYVSPGDADGVFVVTVDDPVDVSFAVPQDRVSALSGKGDVAVEVRAQSGSEVLARGRLLALDNQADGTTGTVTAKARFANADGRLFPNQFVNVIATTAILHGAVTVPVSAVRHGEDGDFVFTVSGDGFARLRKVRTGPSVGNRVAVLSGVRAGERVVSTGADTLDDGIRVSPQADPDARAK